METFFQMMLKTLTDVQLIEMRSKYDVAIETETISLDDFQLYNDLNQELANRYISSLQQ